MVLMGGGVGAEVLRAEGITKRFTGALALGMSDRIVVLAHSRVAGKLPAGATHDQVMALAGQDRVSPA
jgi:hypothetical protein